MNNNIRGEFSTEVNRKTMLVKTVMPEEKIKGKNAFVMDVMAYVIIYVSSKLFIFALLIPKYV